MNGEKSDPNNSLLMLQSALRASFGAAKPER